MSKNLMPEVAKLLGVEIGEEFFIENSDRKSTVAIYADGLHVVLSDAEVSSSNGKLLQKVARGADLVGRECKKLRLRRKSVGCTCAKNAQVEDNNTQKLRVDSGCCAFCNGHNGD